jgi:UDP-glucose 4-epimerase
MAVLVTGGTGFTGVNIVRELAEHGVMVISMDIVPPDGMVQQYVAPWAERVTWLTGDIADRTGVEAASAYYNIDSIVHSAAYTPYGDTEKKNGRRVCDVNLDGTLNMLDLARRLEVKRVLNISSMAVYGLGPSTDQPLKEDAPLEPEGYGDNPYGFYAISKIAGEMLTHRYGHLYGFETASIRMAQNWGPVERVTPYHIRVSLPNYWAGKAVRGEPIEVSPAGTGISQGRSFGTDHIYIKDTAAATRLMLEIPALKYPVYNISLGYPLSMFEMVSAIREAYPGVKFVEPLPEADPTKDIKHMLDLSRIKEDLGFEPKYDLVSSLKDFIEWRQSSGFLD